MLLQQSAKRLSSEEAATADSRCQGHTATAVELDMDWSTATAVRLSKSQMKKACPGEVPALNESVPRCELHLGIVLSQGMSYKGHPQDW